MRRFYLERQIEIGDLVVSWFDVKLDENTFYAYLEPKILDIGIVIKTKMEYAIEKRPQRFIWIKWTKENRVEHWNEGAICNNMIEGKFELIQK